MKTHDPRVQQSPTDKAESSARPLARVNARELPADELARISGGWFISTYSNNGGPDYDLLK
jgi:hypothetical protein